MGDRLGTAGAVGFLFFFLSFWPSQPLYYARFVLLNHKTCARYSFVRTLAI